MAEVYSGGMVFQQSCSKCIEDALKVIMEVAEGQGCPVPLKNWTWVAVLAPQTGGCVSFGTLVLSL